VGPHPHGWWILLHIILFVFWLGGDMGVFYSSRFVLNPALTPAARATALKIMSGLDLGPKVCVILFLPSGLTLTSLDAHGATLFGVALFPWWLTTLAWLGAFGWLWLMWTDHHAPGKHPRVRRADWSIRIAIITAVAATGLYALVADRPFGVDTNPKWLGGKLLLYALAIAAGLGIRLTLRPFGPAFGALMTTGSTPTIESTLRRSVDGCLPYVWTIWASVLGASALGVLKPFAHL
jgi:hypothetical protein